MSQTIRLHVTIDDVCVTGVDLVHKHELAPAIAAQLQAMLQDTGVVFNKSRDTAIASVKAEPLSYHGHIRPTHVGETIARQIAGSIVPTAGNNSKANDKGAP